MLSEEFDKEFSFDINDYLCANYPTMGLLARRSVCSISLSDWLDESVLYDYVDGAVGYYCMQQQNLLKKEEEEEEENE